MVTLQPFSHNDLRDDIALEKLMTWRNAVLHTFDHPIPASLESTKRWLADILHDKFKHLFWVKGISRFQVPFGHVGVIDHHGAYELGYVIRGEQDIKGGMSMAVLQLKMLYYTKPMFLRVIKSNDHAIDFYKRLGFVINGVDGPYFRMSCPVSYHSFAGVSPSATP